MRPCKRLLVARTVSRSPRGYLPIYRWKTKILHVGAKWFLRSFIWFLRRIISRPRGESFISTWAFEILHVGSHSWALRSQRLRSQRWQYLLFLYLCAIQLTNKTTCLWITRYSVGHECWPWHYAYCSVAWCRSMHAHYESKRLGCSQSSFSKRTRRCSNCALLS